MADNTVRHNSPDPTRYHNNIGGMPGTMIPRSGRDGQSKAFDPNKAQTVIVDPGEPGGNFSLDMSTLSGYKDKFNLAAMRPEVSDDPSAFYRGFSEAFKEEKQIHEELEVKLTQTLKEPITVAEPLKPIEPLASFPPVRGPAGPSYEEYADLPHESELEKYDAPRDTDGAIQQLLEEEKSKADNELHRQRERNSMHDRQSPNMSPGSYQQAEMSDVRKHVSRQGDAINSLIGAINRLAEKSAEPPSHPAPSSPPEKEAEEKVEPPIPPMASLKIPFLEGDKPQRPLYETYFETPQMGTMAARYHCVVVGQDCLALVYDTRFEDGFQYLPPNLGEERVKVSVPKLGNSVYTCSSLGLHWDIGCLDVIILIKHEDEEQ